MSEEKFKILSVEIQKFKCSLYNIVERYRTTLKSLEYQENYEDIMMMYRVTKEELKENITSICMRETEKYIKMFKHIDSFFDCLINHSDFDDSLKDISELWFGDFFDGKYRHEESIKKYRKSIEDFDVEGKILDELNHKLTSSTSSKEEPKLEDSSS
jgi:hypothetical protein